VSGHTVDTTSETYGVRGQTAGSLGRAVFGWSQAQSQGTGVWGQADGADGVGVRGYAWDGNGKAGTFGTGVMGTSGSHAFPHQAAIGNAGVVGISQGGSGVFGSGHRGGVFVGVASQIRLEPSSAVSHPSSGFAGDLFVDGSKRLWFCEGGTTWKQIQLV